jgi:alpha-beta hydrolase superfamily lysophospholipase
MSGWADWGTWEGGGLRREVFFFRSGGLELYGSLVVAAEPTRSSAVAVCNSWGVEADRCDPLLRSVAMDFARGGGAGLVFHYPGYGDSYGDLATVALDDLAQAAGDAVEEAARRHPGADWTIAGLALGASVACLAEQQLATGHLLLLQPALCPGTYFRRLSRRRDPLVVGDGSGEGMAAGATPSVAYGYPIPERIATDPAASDASVASALAAFEGEGVVISQPSWTDEVEGWVEPIPSRFERIEAPGRWRFGSRSNPQLARAASEWLDRSVVA